MPQLPELREELLERAASELEAAQALFERVAADPTLGAELDRRLANPGTPLIAALAAWPDVPGEGEALLAVNADNAERFGTLIADLGTWPGLRLVRADGTDAAWMLAQHADRHVEERRGWLTALRSAAAAGEVDPRHLANIADRVAAVAGETQEFGTIMLVAGDGEPEFVVPVRDAARLDERRAAIGLPTVAEDAPHLATGDLAPYGPDRGSAPVNQWPLVLEGHVSVEAALDAGVRRVHRIWSTRPGDRRLGRLRALAREHEVLIDQVEPATIDELVSGRSHGGVVGLVGARRQRRVPELLAAVGPHALLVMLDGVEDPYNHAQAVRTLYAAGVDGLIVRRSWETALGTVTRASAGCTELLPTAHAGSVEDATDACRAAGMRVGCAIDAPDAVDVADADLRGGLLLVIGGERRGVTRSFVDGVDLRVRIGYGRDPAPALGAAAAAAIIGFEALRQRRGARS